MKILAILIWVKPPFLAEHGLCCIWSPPNSSTKYHPIMCNPKSEGHASSQSLDAVTPAPPHTQQQEWQCPSDDVRGDPEEMPSFPRDVCCLPPAKSPLPAVLWSLCLSGHLSHQLLALLRPTFLQAWT